VNSSKRRCRGRIRYCLLRSRIVAMLFLTQEQINAARQSVRRGDWCQGMKTATGPLRSSVFRIGRGLRRTPPQSGEEKHDSFVVPMFSAHIFPLFVSKAKDLEVPTGLDSLFCDVDRQILGKYRLAGGAYGKVEFGLSDRFSENEDAHARDRLVWAARFARASAFGHPNALKALRESWKKWLQLSRGTVVSTAYTASERIASISECLFWMNQRAGNADAAEIVSMKGQLWKDACFLSSHIETRLGVHNHLLNNARGLFRASRVLADLEDAAAWQEQALRLWDEFFPRLILEDGTFAEQSSHYHLLLCRTALEYFLAARLSHRPLPFVAESKLSAMFHLANHLLRHDGSLPRFGDNSPDHTVEDLWGLLAAARHCELLKARPRHAAVTPLTLLYCGMAPRIEDVQSRSQSSFFPDGGFMFLRSKDESMDLAVHADPRPETCAHGTAGRGSFELRKRGHVIVQSPGSLLSSSHVRSAWSHSGLAENCTCLSGLAPAVRTEDRRFTPVNYALRGGAWIFQSAHEIGFRWYGFERLRSDIVLDRTWRIDSNDEVWFEERIAGTGEVLFESHLYLGEGQWKEVRFESRSEAVLQWTDAEGSSAHIHLSLPPRVKVEMEPGCYFPEFGMERATPVLVFKGKVKLPVCWTVKWQFQTVAKEIISEMSQPCAG